MPQLQTSPTEPKTWDIFCQVIDNFGDIGVCWRLSADLASRGHHVRLWVDDASALQWMAPQGACGGVTVGPWPQGHTLFIPGAVVIEAFGCQLPSHVVTSMKQQARQPCWINLEYLSAQDYVERCHGLPSPQLCGPGQGLVKHFFYPGFTAKTGGLLREQGLLERQQRFDMAAWRASHGWPSRPPERWVSLFAYDNPLFEQLLESLATSPTRLLIAPGPLASKAQLLLADAGRYPHLKLHTMPYTNQQEYDHTLWACDLNFVRGEDSFVRAQWAGRPFVWQIYPQCDAVHGIKLTAFLTRFGVGSEPTLASSVSSLHHTWNGLDRAEDGKRLTAGALPPLAAWQQHCQKWRAKQWALDDLCTELCAFTTRAV
jgi:uncharacterized repeat protein (TIGR03837 family)